MKLLHKLNIQYLKFSIPLTLLFGAGLYFILSAVINEEVDEKLAADSRLVENRIAKGFIPGLEPFAMVEKIPERPPYRKFSDITITDPVEDELETVRQLETVTSIGGSTYRIRVSEPKIDAEDLLQTIAGLTVLILCLLTGSLFFINAYIHRSVMKPFYDDLEQIRRFSLQDLEPLRLSQSGIQEFDHLNRIITELTAKGLSDYRTLKQFTENASHELQTPLAVIRTRLETLINDGGLSDRQSERIYDVYSAVDRLSRLNRNLILLTRVENRQFTDIEKIPLADFIRKSAAAFQEILDMKQITTNMDLDASVRIFMSPGLAEILMNNLLSNAVNHNRTGGAISIHLSSDTLTVTNTGSGPVAQPGRIFERFYKENPSSKSAGLGLAIVQKICDINHIRIRYTFENGSHCFRLQFPL